MSNHHSIDGASILVHLRGLLTQQLNDPEQGVVMCDIVPLASGANRNRDARLLLAGYAEQYGIRIRPEDLLELGRDVALQVATELFRGSLAGPRMRGDAEAQAAARSFLQLLGDDAQFFSTFRYTIGQNGSIACTGRMFVGTSVELGFLAIDSTTIGCLMVGDED